MKNNRIWILGTALVSIAILVLGWFLGISPKLAEAADADSQTAQAAAANNVKNVELANLKSQYKLINQIKKSLSDLQVALPATPLYSDFVKSLNAYAAESGASVYAGTTSSVASAQTILTSPGSAAAASGSTAPPSAATANTGSAFNAIPVTVTVRGTYVQVTKFIGLLQSGKRTFLLLTLDIHKPSDAGGFEGAIGGAIFTLADKPGYPDVVDGPDKLLVTPSSTPSPSATSTPSPSGTSTPPATSTPSPSH